MEEDPSKTSNSLLAWEASLSRIRDNLREKEFQNPRLGQEKKSFHSRLQRTTEEALKHSRVAPYTDGLALSKLVLSSSNGFLDLCGCTDLYESVSRRTDFLCWGVQ
ncbi:hypothetical protein L1987_54145 [Smallanthus sonchifolius]|uniref:Uncharacterized protein n=1 Tax=Smallanthus sonchifolius TaxID=185202 RepID=A0ACB9E6Z8_9ASTR|nr:hypothetical protein L1987_54145 [Smallanthus sonchifolius]